MIDLNKPSFIEEFISRAIGTVIGSVEGQKAAYKASQAQYEQNKKRQDAELKLYQE